MIFNTSHLGNDASRSLTLQTLISQKPLIFLHQHTRMWKCHAQHVRAYTLSDCWSPIFRPRICLRRQCGSMSPNEDDFKKNQSISQGSKQHTCNERGMVQCGAIVLRCVCAISISANGPGTDFLPAQAVWKYVSEWGWLQENQSISQRSKQHTSQWTWHGAVWRDHRMRIETYFLTITSWKCLWKFRSKNETESSVFCFKQKICLEVEELRFTVCNAVKLS